MKVKRVLSVLLASFCTFFAVAQTLPVKAADGVNVISVTEENQWFQNEKSIGQGNWTANSEKVTVDAFGCLYAMEGATYLSSQVPTLGAYEFEATINIKELNSVENPMVGIIPLYIDEDNYLSLQIKFT